jgi:uncharacterized membrane protein
MRDGDAQQEWSDPRNWRGGWLGLYGSKRDPRLWVPKRQRWRGWTINLEHPKAPLLVAGLVAAVAAVVGVLASRR